MQIYLNGSITDRESSTVPVSDRGFIFGDGVYEVIRTVDGQLFKEKEHLLRLREGLDALQIDDTSCSKLPEISRNLLEMNNLLTGEGTIYIQITRGAAWPRTHTFPEPAVEPTVYVSTAPFRPSVELHKSGIDVITLPDQRWLRCNLKTVNLLPNILARQQAVNAGVNSALMIRDGMVTESPNANIFGVRGSTLMTFPASNYILSGITRQVIFELADQLEIRVETLPVQEKDLFDLDELFFTGTTTDIQPVVEINGRLLGNGKPGPVVRRLQDAYSEVLYDQAGNSTLI